MKLKIGLSVISTSIIFGVASWLNITLSLVQFGLFVYLLPIITNIIIDYFVRTDHLFSGGTVLAAITVTGYSLFANIMEHHPQFDEFIHKQTYRSGNLYMGLEPGLADISQLIFVFALNLSVLYFIQYLSRGDFSHVRRK